VSLTKEQKAFRRKWVAALRSGKYKQGDGFLRSEKGFCCLGVACDLAAPEKWINTVLPISKRASWEHMNEIHYPDPEWFGNLTGLVSADFYGSDGAIPALNDGDPSIGRERHTFEEIADTIELLTLADSE
jgi:hypothetical protein